MKARSGLVALATNLMLMLPAAGASTGLLEQEVTVTAYCCTAPIESNRISDPKTAIVGSGVEFPAGLIGGSIIASDIDVSDFAIDIQYRQSSPAQVGEFNGYAFDFALGGQQRITGVFLAPSSTFSAGDVGLSFDRDSVFYSGAGLTFTQDVSRVLIEVTLQPVPEPTVAATLLIGAAVLGARRQCIGAIQKVKARRRPLRSECETRTIA